MTLYFTGASGQVGRAMVALFPHAVGLTRRDVDLAGDVVDLRSFFSTPPPPHSVLINLAAYTAVDDAEAQENRELVHRINAIAPGELARQSQELGMAMIQVSTEYVLSGRREKGQCNPTTETPAPLSYYGQSKWEGEQAALAHGAHVVRTSWVYTGPRNSGRDFVKTMADLAGRGIDPNVVNDQWGRPTYAPHLAGGLGEMARALAGQHEAVDPADIPQVLHCAGSGEPITWYELATASFAAAGYDSQRVTGIATSEYPTPAKRPLNAALCVDEWERLGLAPLPAWQAGLAKAMQ